MTGGTLNYQKAPSLPYKGFRAISQARNEANGHYNSLQVDLNSQASKDLQLRAFYTLSRSIDPTTGGSGQDLNGVTNPYLGWRYDLGPSQFDRLHNFSANFIYNIPVLRNSSNGFMKSVVGGWALSGIITIESGLPVNFTGGSNIVGGANSPGNRPDLNGSISYMHEAGGVLGPLPAHPVRTIPRCFRLPHPVPGVTSATTLYADRAATTGTSLSSRPSPSGRVPGCSFGLRASTPSTTPNSRTLITASATVASASSRRPTLRELSSSPGRFTFNL